jgi:hypothetical protein
MYEKKVMSKWKKSRCHLSSPRLIGEISPSASPEIGITLAYKVCSKMSLTEGSEEDEG